MIMEGKNVVADNTLTTDKKDIRYKMIDKLIGYLTRNSLLKIGDNDKNYRTKPIIYKK